MEEKNNNTHKKRTFSSAFIMSPSSCALQSHRMRLKESFENNELHIYDKTLKKSRSSTELRENPKDTLVMIQRSNRLGGGSYGSAHTLVNDSLDTICVGKVGICNPPLIGSLRNPFRSENAEHRMAKLLWEHFVETNITPHICMLLGKPCITNGTIPQNKGKDMDCKYSSIQFMEHAYYDNAKRFMREEVDNEHFDLYFRVILFQVTFTLCQIYKKFRYFRHNDLKSDNVLVQEGLTQGYSIYYDDKTIFAIPSTGFRTLLADFDYSCIRGLIDNGKVIEDTFNSPSYNINDQLDYRSDIYLFIKTLYHDNIDRIPNVLDNQLSTLYSHNQLDLWTAQGEDGNFMHPTPSLAKTLPTAQRILRSDLFKCFIVKNPEELIVMEEWNKKKNETFTHLITFPAWDPHDILVEINNTNRGRGKTKQLKDMVRRIPIIYPRDRSTRNKGKRKQMLVPVLSFSYFVTWPTKPDNLDSMFGKVELYKPSFGAKIRPLLKDAYQSKPSKRNIDYFDLPPENMKEFLDRVEQIADGFIDSHYVPRDWWYAVFTMAFVDTVYEMDLARVGQPCWFVDSWCDFWENEQKYTKRQMFQFALQWNWLKKKE